MFPTSFHSKRLSFTVRQASDAEEVFEAYAADSKVTRYLTWKAHETVEETREFLSRGHGTWTEGEHLPWLLRVSESGQVVGMIGATPQAHRAEIGYVIARPLWGQGYATEALEAVISEIFKHTKILRIQAYCDVENLASVKVLEKSGMLREGTLRCFGVHPNRSPVPRDAHIYAIVRAPDFQPKQRFTKRVQDYILHRPSYPKDLIDHLGKHLDFSKLSMLADIGAGTGILTKLLLERGVPVTAVEPNDAMREAMNELIGEQQNYQSRGNSAEETGFDDQSVGAITVAQAFHWFDADKTRAEFQRILEPGGQVALIWNSRLSSEGTFTGAYEELCQRFGTDYEKSRMHNFATDEVLESFFGPDGYQSQSFANYQRLDEAGLIGRLRSCSYIPTEESPLYPEFLEASKALFQKFQDGGTVLLEYQAKLYWGPLS